MEDKIDKRIINTILEMFQQRLYKNIINEGSKIIAFKGKKKIVCYITDIEKFNTEKVQEYIKLMEDDETKHSIIVYKDFITSTAKKNIEKLPTNSDISIKIELFSYKNLIFNITKHRLQPVFSLLTLKEANEFKKKYGKMIPVMFTCDPISNFFDYKPGDIIKTTDRKTGYVSYRIIKLKS